MDLTDILILLLICLVVFVFIIKRGRRSSDHKESETKPSVEPAASVPEEVGDDTLATWREEDAPAAVQLTAFAATDQPTTTPAEDLRHFRLLATEPTVDDVASSDTGEAGRWLMPDETVMVAGRQIHGGWFYYGEVLLSSDQQRTETALVNPALPVDWIQPDRAGESVGYWPNYDDIDPRSRAAYLHWLMSDRDDPSTYIGYVFLYFYGLERRLLTDDIAEAVSADERTALLHEIMRLRTIYAHNRSFNNYATNLITHIQVLHHIHHIHQMDYQLPELDILYTGRNFNAAFQYALGVTIQAGEPVPARLALAWVRSHPEFNLRTPARRCAKLFDRLFKLRFQQHFGDGLVVKQNKARLRLEYRSASESLRGYPAIPLDLPDASYLKRPFSRLMKLAEACTTELEAYSRFIGVKDNQSNSLNAISKLPDEIVQYADCDAFNCLQNWVKTQLTGNLWCLVSLSDVLHFFGACRPTQINKTSAELLADVLEKMGVGMAPDRRYHHASPALDGKIVLFAGGHGTDFSPSTAFASTAARLRLGAMVASIDQEVHQTEVEVLEHLIQANTELSEIERRSLQAYLYWRLQTPASTAGLKALFATIGATEQHAISQILLQVALSDGVIASAEIRQLEKLYRSLGLDIALVRQDLDQLLGSQPEQAEPQAVSTSAAELVLDTERLNRLTAETHEVQAVLAAIFAEGEEPEVPPAETASSYLSSELDIAHQALYDRLITRSDWSRDALQQQCQPLGLMPEGALEVINDWSYEQVDAPVLEVGDPCYVDQELVAELSALRLMN